MAGPTGTQVRRDIRWSPRQKQVLDLLAKRRTNGQIAEELGISLDGAKYHVSEVITKLDVDSREEAAEWWRQQKGLRARLRVLTRTGSAPAVVRWLGLGGAGASALAVIAIVSVVIIGGGADQEAASPEQTPVEVSTEPVATGVATPNVPDDDDQGSATLTEIGGVPVRELSRGEDVSLDDYAVIIETGCYQCDGPATSLLRLYRSDSGDLVQDTLFEAPGDEARYIHSYDVSPDMSRMLVTVCSAGYCGGVGPPTNDGAVSVFESSDGGMNWELLAERDRPSFFRYAPDGGYLFEELDNPDGEPADWTWNIYRWPGMERVATWEHTGRVAVPIVLDDGSLVTISDEGKRLLRPNGDVYYELPQTESRITHVTNPNGTDGMLMLLTTPDEHEPRHLALLKDGKLEWIVRRLDSGSGTTLRLQVQDVISPIHLLGNDIIAGGTLPAIINVNSGTVHRIEGPFGGREDEDAELRGRNMLIAAVANPLGRVETGGTCLNVREEPSTDAESVRCYVDGVLLFEREVEEEVDGWLPVRTPDGREGWASAEFVER